MKLQVIREHTLEIVGSVDFDKVTFCNTIPISDKEKPHIKHILLFKPYWVDDYNLPYQEVDWNSLDMPTLRMGWFLIANDNQVDRLFTLKLTPRRIIDIP